MRTQNTSLSFPFLSLFLVPHSFIVNVPTVCHYLSGSLPHIDHDATMMDTVVLSFVSMVHRHVAYHLLYSSKIGSHLCSLSIPSLTMKIFLWLPLYVAALMPLPSSAAAGVFRGGAKPKVSICHWNTISVGESAVPGHLAHGDLEGACDSPENCAARCNDCTECTIDSCDPAGGCVNTPDNSKCEASDVCYVGKCDPANGCVETPVAVTDPPTIDGVIEEGEWADAATATIGNGGGTAYFIADTSYIYGAFDITGWTIDDGGSFGRQPLGLWCLECE